MIITPAKGGGQNSAYFLLWQFFLKIIAWTRNLFGHVYSPDPEFVPIPSEKKKFV
jgi:hypothetical protein